MLVTEVTNFTASQSSLSNFNVPNSGNKDILAKYSTKSLAYSLKGFTKLIVNKFLHLSLLS